MLAENQDYSQQPLFKTDGSFQREKYSLNTTEIHSIHENSLNKQDSNKFDLQQTLPELPPFSSRALDFEQSITLLPMQNQINELMERFSGIHKMLINHSQYQSSLHQRRRGFKAIQINHAHLIPDYSNKANIISDIVQIVQGFQIENQTKNIQQLLETKFLEYYLQRHYGGLEYQSNNLSIQLKLQQKEQSYKENGQQYEGKLQGGQTFIQQSQQSQLLMCSQYKEGKQNDEEIEIIVQTIKIIEVQIPVIVYKLKQVVICEESYQKSSQIYNIGSIINKYSKRYQNNFKDTVQDEQYFFKENVESVIQQNQKEDTPQQSRIIASIMIDSNHRSFTPKQTEVELIYSESPQQSNFKLPLDSFAQIQSLISNSNSSGSSTDQHSRPPTQRDCLIPISQEIIITEKGINPSLLQKIQQNQRALNQENLQLKQSLVILQQKLYILQKRNKDLQAQNQKYHKRLEEQIQQTEYLSNKLDEINAQILQQKIQCLTHLNLAKDRKIQSFTFSITQSSKKIQFLTRESQQIEKALHLSTQEIIRKDQEIQLLSKQLLQKERQLQQIEKCQNTVIEIATNSQQNLKKYIENLEAEKLQLQEEIKQYKKRLNIQGINLEYEQAAQIQGIIQSRQYVYSLQIHDINKRYEQVISLYQDQIRQMKSQISNLQQANEQQKSIIAQKEVKEKIININHQQYYKKMQDIINQYDQQLERKDQQILALKSKDIEDQELQYLLQKFVQTIKLLQNQLIYQRNEAAKVYPILLSQQKKQNMDETQYEEKLIEGLTTELENKMKENKQIKEKLEKQSALIVNLLENQGQVQSSISIKKENQKLKDINRKLKKYTLILQQQIKKVCAVNQCQSHRNWVNSLIDQKNYFCDLATKQFQSTNSINMR